tara:strand:+ start:7902 stop:8927 length:1026 start_codon:yes stop_codon:yes gene_type:complete
MSRLSSLDFGYEIGDLSIYPEAIDSTDTLYEATNNAETVLSNTLSYNARIIVVDDTSSFPDKGVLRVGGVLGQPGSYELIYYAKKTGNTFQELVRAFAASRQNQWRKGSAVAGPVAAEFHNAVRDATINVEQNLGLIDAGRADPEEDGPLNGILKEIEVRFLAPRPFFRASYLKGPAPLAVRFQNFASGQPIRFLWDFGDGTQSIEPNPIHTYLAEGFYTVSLNVINSTGGQGVATKFAYIEVNDEERLPFFYISPIVGQSIDTVGEASATEFEFVDQTDGDILQRFWVFDDGTNANITDPNVHTIKHQYESPGEYSPSLLVIFSSQRLKRIFLQDNITVE